jgi:very-short-patch-repair endonuclease
MYERYKRKQIICTTCNPFGQSSNSKPQLDVLKFLIDNDISNIVTNNRQILNGKEVDIYLPDFNIAIEYDGLYWHNSSFVGNDYHLKKTVGCQEKGVKLIHIFEDEWIHKQEIVKSRILNLLKKTPNKIFARKCVIKELSNDECKEFLNENHIQGNVYSRYKIGLFFNDKLVSVMTFGGVRSIMSSKNTLSGYELSRFCNKLNTNVIGSASKLLNYFIKVYKPNRIVSYADVRWSGINSENTIYTTLGFTYKHTSKPNYWYVKNEFRYHRGNFTKQSLIKEGFDSTKTEKEIMVERNYNRIYDCGHLVYEIEF